MQVLTGRICAGLMTLAMLETKQDAGTREAARLRSEIEAGPRLALHEEEVPIALERGQAIGMVSSVAVDRARGLLWVLQRGAGCEPVLAVDQTGRVIHAFGKGRFKTPHAIRVDPEGFVWTVDAGNSVVTKWSADGSAMLHINLGGSGNGAANSFGGATDVAFGPGGAIVVSDGYARARVAVFSSAGVPEREWGSPGAGPGAFHLPHSVVIDREGTVYVADRENGRIERFDLQRRLLGVIGGLGRTYALALGPDGALWASMQPMNEPPGSAGWLVKMDRTSGRELGYVPVPEPGGLHTIEVDGDGQPLTDLGNKVVRFVRDSAQPAR